MGTHYENARCAWGVPREGLVVTPSTQLQRVNGRNLKDKMFKSISD